MNSALVFLNVILKIKETKVKYLLYLGLFDFDESFRSIQDEEILDSNLEKKHPFKDVI
jgi:hypothetical protein